MINSTNGSGSSSSICAPFIRPGGWSCSETGILSVCLAPIVQAAGLTEASISRRLRLLTRANLRTRKCVRPGQLMPVLSVLTRMCVSVSVSVRARWRMSAPVEQRFGEQQRQIEESVGAVHGEVQGVRGELAAVDYR